MQKTKNEKLAQILSDLRLGLPIGFHDGVFMAIEPLTEARFGSVLGHNPQIVLSAQRALDLQLTHDPSNPAALKLPHDYRYHQLKALADPVWDLDYPGKGPLAQGELPIIWRNRMLDICKLAHILPAVVFIRNRVEGAHVLTEEMWDLVKEPPIEITPIANARIPLKLAGESRLQLFRNPINDSEHYAAIIGQIQTEKPPLVRLHSACFTGDCLGSLKCDCGPQLHAALEKMRDVGGVLLYLSQEGRGIGLANKLRAYRLQEQGFDTVEANLKLGFDDDERDFRIGAAMLSALRISGIRLMTNNPRKVKWLQNSGIEVVERVPLIIQPQPENADYLDVKRRKAGHYL